MSIFALTTGVLVADPARRTGAKGEFATGTLRASTDGGAVLVSLIAFKELAQRLLVHRAGAAIAASGRATLSSWIGKDGVEHHGISVVVDQLASAVPSRRSPGTARQGADHAAGAPRPSDDGGRRQ